MNNEPTQPTPNNGPMIGWIVGLLVIILVLILGTVFYVKSAYKNDNSSTINATIVENSPSPTAATAAANPSPTPSTAATSSTDDASLNNDLKSVDTNMTSYTQSATSADAGLNDKQGDLSE